MRTVAWLLSTLALFVAVVATSSFASSQLTIPSRQEVKCEALDTWSPCTIKKATSEWTFLDSSAFKKNPNLGKIRSELSC